MNKHQILEEGERLMRELERREAEREARRRGQKHVMWTDERGNLCSLVVREGNTR